MTGRRGREWWLRRHVTGRPAPADVELVEVDVEAPPPGSALVANEFMSVEPYMRGRMDGRANYAAPYELDRPMTGSAVGRVVSSDSLPVGALVRHDLGWREYATVPAKDCELLPATDLPASAFLGVLGIPGLTAWAGLNKIARLREGETVFVSSAAGGVGSVAVQLAKAAGCTVLASAGSAEKVLMVREVLGADAVFDHRGPVTVRLKEALAEAGSPGIDVYFDNVGGEQLEAALRFLNDRARVVLCGMISIYNNTGKTPGPANLIRLVWRRARMEGFLVSDHLGDRPEFEAELTGLIRRGAVKPVETVVRGGIEAAFDALLGMLGGRVTGKTVVSLVSDNHHNYDKENERWRGARHGR
ncbi:NADP-dependent oxidoreductase [Amycolatopsis acidicola]|uniref:NADP-dependent oxidoreductase n=1 Tax=Amycolatopsis acidicola TaxID=2596893 RepID=UPI001FB66A18|nr:NADP-dependent oxidoreductase [Amycolatopsis acidicola]